MAENRKVKTFLWTIPRSCSTAFLRAIAERQDTKIIFEPYLPCYYYSSERQSERYEVEAHQGYTFQEGKQVCEKEYPEQYIFAKDAAYQLGGRFDAIPEGFQHTFLIRNPSKTVRSLYNIILNGEETGWTYFDASEVGFKQLMELFKHVTTTLCQEAIVIDADDLFKNSAGILKKYCQKIGMEYKDSMIQWDDSSKSFQQNFTKMWHPWLKNAFTTKKFEDTLQGKKQDKDMPEVFHEAIKESMHIYYELYKYKLEANA